MLLPLLLSIGNELTQTTGMVLKMGWQFDIGVLRKHSNAALPNTIWSRLSVLQFETKTTLANHAVQIGLKLFKFANVCQTTMSMQQRYLSRHLYFAAFFQPHHPKRQLLLVALIDQIKVSNFKNLKRQPAIRK